MAHKSEQGTLLNCAGAGIGPKAEQNEPIFWLASGRPHVASSNSESSDLRS